MPACRTLAAGREHNHWNAKGRSKGASEPGATRGARDKLAAPGTRAGRARNNTAPQPTEGSKPRTTSLGPLLKAARKKDHRAMGGGWGIKGLA
ncbi:MAG: hypothetical protein JRI51_13240 [Deltaproteobacteria bacterium]|nr:hypothetical protein [Deltaproteobacteria bacterium]